MLAKKIISLSLALGVLLVATSAFAQNSDSETKKTKTLGDRLDNLGRIIFGGTIPPEKPLKDKEAKDKEKTASQSPIQYGTPRQGIAKPSTTAKPSPIAKPTVEMPSRETTNPYVAGRRSGSVLDKSESGSTNSSLLRGSNNDAEFTPENMPPAVSRNTDASSPVKNGLRSSPAKVYRDTDEATGNDSYGPPPVVSERARSTVSNRNEYSRPTIENPVVNPKGSQRSLQERLSSMQVSVFGANGEESTNATPTMSPQSRPSEPATTKPSEPALTTPATEPVTPPRTTSLQRSATSDTLPVVRNGNGATKSPETLVVETNAGQAPVDPDNMLIARKGPALSVETLGPRRIMVGKEASYEVSMINAGDVSADDLRIFITTPDWAEVVGVETAVGEAKPTATEQGAGLLVWNLGHLDAKGRERLTIRLVPHQSRPFDLAVRWEYRPVASQAAIEVQEPKLALQLEGPREVLYGKKESYRLKLINIGNGKAENVVLTLLPIGGGENVPATHRIGVLGANEEKALDVELTARQAGNLTIQVDVKAEGNAKAEMTEKIIVRRAGLKVDVDGPKVQFVGATTTYTIRIRNPGTAPARSINMTASLPAGAKYLSGVDGVKIDLDGSKLDWIIESMAPDAEQVFTIKCLLNAAGMSRVQIAATAADDLAASSEAITRVEAVANLSMEVKDPENPVQVGDEAIYEVHIRNRGTKSATGVEISAFFSRGIEPTNAEGSPNRLAPGQVVFQPIPLLTPGSEVVLKVRARAEMAGNHIFRAEAQCKPLGMRLVREATNLYYSETASSQQQIAEEVPLQNPAAKSMQMGSRPPMLPPSSAPSVRK
jgi:uncharacterized repeat protein (TIGR01451 family)